MKKILILIALLLPKVAGAQERIMYAQSRANVRSGPGTSYEIVTVVERGDPIRIGSQGGTWWPVIRHDSTIGYIHRSLVGQMRQPRISTRRRHGECRRHIELLSPREIAAEMMTTEAWVVSNYRVNLWVRPTTQGRGRKVGEMLPGSRAVILEEGSQDFKVQSPLDQSVGWVNRIQVKRRLYQNTQTRRRCQP